jgi:MFS family permease
MLQSSSPPSIETRESWVIAVVALILIGTAFGAPWLITVGLKEVAAEVGGVRSIPSLAIAMAWMGAAIGGILMGRVAERFGVRSTVLFGTLMIALGLFIATLGPRWQMQVGFGLFVGILGIGGINAPLYIYVTRWFDRRRGSALALISSGTYFAGALWPPLFERAIAYGGWRQAMLWFAGFQLVVILPLAAIFLKPAPEAPASETAVANANGAGSVLGWPPNVVFALLCAASFLCCVTMSMPQQHLVAFCSDLGIAASSGALMISVLLGVGFFCRQIWGLISDRIGGLTTLLMGSAAQAFAMTGFLLTQSEAGLFAVSAAFGIAFSGLIPAYILAGRELFPASEASWRIPVLLLTSGSGMATGGWLAGALHDQFGFYAPAFAVGVAFNVANFAILAVLVGRQTLRPAPA